MKLDVVKISVVSETNGLHEEKYQVIPGANGLLVIPRFAPFATLPPKKRARRSMDSTFVFRFKVNFFIK